MNAMAKATRRHVKEEKGTYVAKYTCSSVMDKAIGLISLLGQMIKEIL